MRHPKDKIVSSIKNLQTKLTKRSGTKILVGGCFDILHTGHISFLENAKKQGDILIVLLESDKSIKKSKGDKRPLNIQKDRAYILASLEMVDYILLLAPNMTNQDYDSLAFSIKPAIIATTANDPYRSHKERQASQIGAKVIDVMQPISNKSTSLLFTLLQEL